SSIQSMAVLAVGGKSANNGLAVTDDGTMLWGVGNNWYGLSNLGSWRGALWHSETDNAWIVGDPPQNYLVSVVDPVTVVGTSPSNSPARLFSVWGSRSDDVWAVRSGGAIT